MDHVGPVRMIERSRSRIASDHILAASFTPQAASTHGIKAAAGIAAPRPWGDRPAPALPPSGSRPPPCWRVPGRWRQAARRFAVSQRRCRESPAGSVPCRACRATPAPDNEPVWRSAGSRCKSAVQSPGVAPESALSFRTRQPAATG